MLQVLGPVAVVQFEPNESDVWQNLDMLRMLVQQATIRGATLVVFPELCLAPQMIESADQAAEFSQTMTGYQTKFVCDVANSTMSSIVFGYVEFEDANFYNSAALVCPESGLVANVRKHNLHSTDYIWASPSDDMFPQAVFENGRVGMMIGSDVRNRYDDSYPFLQDPPQKFYERGSVDLVCVLDGVRRPQTDFPCDEWVELAKSIDSNVAVSNRVGFDVTGACGGGSCMIDRDVRVWSMGTNHDSTAIVGGALS